MSDSTADPDETISYEYQFTFDDGVVKIFTVTLNAKTLDIIQDKPVFYPPWTALAHCQCPNCPLKPAQHSCCPIAINLVDLVDFFRDSYSYEKAHILITTATRSYQKHTSLQEGVSSLLGIYMVSSGCPILSKLRPMLRAHIPFSTVTETQYRLLSLYLLAQYLL
ncbi:MAG: hypothetical protein ACE5G8_07820 [Anaerolineae bacterium]